MKILIVGAGGREHALAWSFCRAGHQVLAAPGNPGIAQIASCFPIAPGELDAIEELALEHQVELVVVGPEAPLVAGLADRLRSRGICVFGPGATGAQLEGSKIFSKEFFHRHGIRTAEFVATDSVATADAAVDRFGCDVVVKADGLAAGKGVVVCSTVEQAKASIRDMLVNKRFGEACSRIVVERRIRGRELSVMALTDGNRLEVLAQAEDHKAVFDGDKGANTGGMGAVSPPRWADDSLVTRIREQVFVPTLVGLQQDGIDYRGVLYAGLMIDEHGVPWLLEYNCRFGDPETQPILTRLASDLAVWLEGAAKGALPPEPLVWEDRCSVCVVLTAQGYPQTPQTGDVIHGLAKVAMMDDVVVFHAGTRKMEDSFVTSGGRVLGVTALANTTEEARALAYRAVERIEFPGMHYRRDIGKRGLKKT